jgi:hypothetical protein
VHALQEVYEAQQGGSSSYSRELLSFLATVGKVIWNGHQLSEFRVCDTPRWTNCTCTLDTEGMPLDHLYDIVEPALRKARAVFPGQSVGRSVTEPAQTSSLSPSCPAVLWRD